MRVFEFGVASGNTLLSILRCFANRGKLPSQIIGFDSFKGLPQEAANIPRSGDWFEGAFNLFHEFKNNNELTQKPNVDNVYDAIQFVKSRFSEYGDLVQFVIGFYEDSLNKKTIEDFKIKPASFVNIDVDLYISAKQVLEFLLENNLLLEDAVLRYDDWTGTNEYAGGESLAHKEAIEKYGAVFEGLGTNCPWSRVFRYKGKK